MASMTICSKDLTIGLVSIRRDKLAAAARDATHNEV